MQCPKCAGRMTPVVMDDVTVDRCELCRGIWFDAAEGEKLAAATGGAKVDDGSAFVGEMKNACNDVDCPRCNGPMVSVRPDEGKDFHVERCPTCKGAFFDAGEFKQVVLDRTFWEKLSRW